MCGRFALYSTADLMKWLHGMSELPALRPRYNIAPTDIIPVVRQVPDAPVGRREVAPMRWGFVPPWAKDVRDGPLMINARCETLNEKPAFRGALRHHRCLVPADGFFEWETTKAGKQPLFFHRRDRALLGMAGLWSTWQGPNGEVVDSCTILTSAPNPLVAPIHDRMPLILPAERFDAWLDPRAQDEATLSAFFVPYPAEEMAAYPVTPRMNKTDFDEPAAVAPGGQQALF